MVGASFGVLQLCLDQDWAGNPRCIAMVLAASRPPCPTWRRLPQGQLAQPHLLRSSSSLAQQVWLLAGLVASAESETAVTDHERLGKEELRKMARVPANSKKEHLAAE